MNYNKLKNKRCECGFTQKSFAIKLNMTEVTYNRKENGKREFVCSEIGNIINELCLTENETIEIFFG